MEDEVLAVEARRVETWLNQNGITSLADFAFWYSSFEEALDDAGRAVATAWQRARQDSSLGIAGLVRQLFEQERAARNRPVEPMAPPPRPGPSQAVAAPVPAIVLAKPSRSRRLAAAPLAEPVGDRNQDLVHQLMSILLAAGTHRPSDGQGDSMVRANFGDMASRICNRSERATITKALTTWSELREFARQRGSTVGALNAHELGHFIRGHRFAQRALVAFRWMVRNMPLTYDLALVQQPAAQSGQRFGVGASQAPVAPPLLVWQLNDLLEGNVNESAWTALLGAWMMIFGLSDTPISNGAFSHVVTPSLCTSIASGASNMGFVKDSTGHALGTPLPVSTSCLLCCDILRPWAELMTSSAVGWFSTQPRRRPGPWALSCVT